MPAANPNLGLNAEEALRALSERVRFQRKALGLSAVATSEAAGLSRVTLHRIEKGEPSVTIGAYANALAALGLRIEAVGEGEPEPAPQAGHIPVRIRLADYPQLAKLAWQLHGGEDLTPVEALDIYERNARHLDENAMGTAERQLLDALRQGLAGGARRV